MRVPKIVRRVFGTKPNVDEFLAETCEVAPGRIVILGTLYDMYKGWAGEHEQRVVSRVAFKRAIQRWQPGAAFDIEHSSKTGAHFVLVRGVGLKPVYFHTGDPMPPALTSFGLV